MSDKIDRNAVVQVILHELDHAEKKFPGWPNDPVHAAAIVAEEAGELIRASLQFTYEEGLVTDMYDEAIQVGAMAIRFIQDIRNYKERKSEGQA